jgi:predicted metal-dependent hydrolase
MAEQNTPTQPLIVITGAPAWTGGVRQTLGNTYKVVEYAERAGYVTRLVDDHAAMILVNGDSDEWKFWTATPKSSPATRRIPLALISDNKERRVEALTTGADLSYAPDELLADAKAIVADYARVRTLEEIERLDCECQEALPEMARQGMEKFNTGEYYKQHDLFEALWVQTEGSVRDLYRAILQVGVAYYQITRGNYPGALKMLLRSVQWLAVLPDMCQGVDVGQLRADSYRVRAALESIKPEEIASFDRSLLKPIRLADGKK